MGALYFIDVDAHKKLEVPWIHDDEWTNTHATVWRIQLFV